MMKKNLFLLSVLILFSSASFARIDSIGTRVINDQLYIIYMVNAGETIYSISTKYQVPIEVLMNENPELENGLKTGQVINIPYYPEKVKAQKEADDAIYHKVESGETLFSLSKKYNVQLNDLLRWNGMELKAGQEIVVGYNKQPTTKTGGKTNNSTTTTSTTKPVNPDMPTQSVLGAKTRKRVLIVPFDPYLYFSDADDEIARASQMQRTEVRQIFRRRLNALIDPPGYETIHLLGGVYKDSLGDLNKIYKSVTYNYQDILENGRELDEQFNRQSEEELSLLDKAKSLKNITNANRSSASKDDGRYFGVKIKDPNFFTYFNTKYEIDYYVFINQFEVKTNYEHCLDRATQNYERSFLVHYSIFKNNGEQLVGSKLKIRYESNSNNVSKIVKDNIPKAARQIMTHLPDPTQK